MKLSDIYKLPMNSEYDCILDKDCRYKIDFDVSDSNCEDQVMLVAKAINNHDALVKALNDLLNDCINFDGSKLSDCYLKQASDLLSSID